MNLLTDPMFWMTVIGTVTGIAGLFYSIISWRAAVSAQKTAISAREAAQSATNQIQRINLLAEASRLQMLCINIDNFIDLRAYKEAKHSTKEVRLGVVLLKEDTHAQKYLVQDVWETMLNDLASIDYVLTEAVLKKAHDSLPLKDRSDCGKKIDSVGTHLTIVKKKCQLAAQEIK